MRVPSGWLAGLSYFIMGFGPMIWIIGTATLRQTATQGARPLGVALGAAPAP